LILIVVMFEVRLIYLKRLICILEKVFKKSTLLFALKTDSKIFMGLDHKKEI
jgi:hypothetical protein